MKKPKKSAKSKPKMENRHKLRPLGDRVLIEEQAEGGEQKTSFGIIIPAGSSEDKNSKRGKVVSVGTGRIENGKTTPISVKVGDEVIFQWGEKIKIDEKEFYVVRESEILAVINK